MYFHIIEFLYEYTKNISEPIKLLPIVVLLYLIWRWKRIMQFWIDKENPMFRQSTREPREQLVQLLFSEPRKVLILVFLLTFVSWTLFFSFLTN